MIPLQPFPSGTIYEPEQFRPQYRVHVQSQWRYAESDAADEDDFNAAALYGQALSRLPDWVAEDETEAISTSYGQSFPVALQPSVEWGVLDSISLPMAGWWAKTTSSFGAPWPKTVRVDQVRWRVLWLSTHCYIRYWWKHRFGLIVPSGTTYSAWSQQNHEPIVVGVDGFCLRDPANFHTGLSVAEAFNRGGPGGEGDAWWLEVPIDTLVVPSPMPIGWRSVTEVSGWRFTVVPGWEPAESKWLAAYPDPWDGPLGPFPAQD